MFDPISKLSNILPFGFNESPFAFEKLVLIEFAVVLKLLFVDSPS